jgi:hypothetical protein
METSSNNEEEAQVALQLGQRALSQLALQVRAAQIEARKAELELIMEQAQNGDIAPLQRWLRVNGHYQSQAPIDSSIRPEAPVEAVGLPVSWDGYRQLAIARLRRRHASVSTTTQSNAQAAQSKVADVRLDPAQRLRSASAGASESDLLSEAEKESKPEADDWVAEQVAAEEMIEEKERVNELASETSELQIEDTPAEEELTTVSPELLAELKLNEPVASDSSKLATRGRWRGVIISAIVHVLVVIALAAVTLDTPVKDGLLSLVASETSSSDVESFELMPQPETPESVTEPLEATTQPLQADLSTAIPSMSESISSPLTQTVAASATNSTSAMMAAKADSNKEMVSFYGAESSGNSFCFVLDGSGSMRGSPWEAARIELLRSISGLKPNQRFYIIFFNKEVYSITQPGERTPARAPLYATPENLAHAKRWLDTLQITTGEPPLKAMETALQIECDCIYFLADGEMSEAIGNKLLASLRKLNRANDIIDGEVVVVPIHTIAYHSEKGIALMRRVAEENRGQFKHVAKPATSRKASGK